MHINPENLGESEERRGLGDILIVSPTDGARGGAAIR